MAVKFLRTAINKFGIAAGADARPRLLTFYPPCRAAEFAHKLTPLMTAPTANRTDHGFTPLRFGLLLALLIAATFPQVLAGVETFVARDYGFFAYPLAHFQQDCLRHGEFPLWNPYNNCGVPFLAQWNTMPLYPPALAALALPLGWSLSFFCLAHLWWAGFGMFFLARRWTGNDFAAAFAGLAFAFNGFTLNLLMWPSHIATFAWLPWVVLVAELAWRMGAEKIILAAFAGAMQMLAGGPETIFLTWLFVAALWLQQFFMAGRDASSPPRRAMLWRLPLVVALVISLTLVQLLPFLDLVAHAQRETGYTDLRWSLPGWGWVNFLVPMAFGSTVTEGIFFQHGQYWTSSYYLGLGTLWLVVIAAFCVRERRVWLLTGAGIFALLCALGDNTPFYPLLRKLIPQLSFITYPVKFVMIAVFVAPLLAAFALANLEKVRQHLFALGGILLTLIGGILIWTQLAPMSGDDSHATLLNGFSRAAMLILTGGALWLITRASQSRWLRIAPLLLLLIAWVDVLTHEPRQNPTVLPTVYESNDIRTMLAMNPQPELGGPRAMLAPAAALELTRFAVSDPANNFLAKRLGYCGNANLLDAVPKVDGFFSLTPREYDRLLTFVYTVTNADFGRLKDFMGVAQITAPGELLKWQSRPTAHPLLTAGLQPVFLDDAQAMVALARNDFDGSKTVYLPPEEKYFVTVSNQTAAKIRSAKFGIQSVDAEVEAAEPALVTVAQTFYHHWRATVDGQPVRVLRANVAFQAVPVPAGKHTLRLDYVDSTFEIGGLISLLMWINCAVVFLVLLRRYLPPAAAAKDADDYF